MKSFLAIFTVVLLLSCEKIQPSEEIYIPVQICTDISNQVDTVKKYHQGTWKWLEDKSYSSYGWVYETPHLNGYEMTLKLSGDTATYYRNGTQEQQLRFRIQVEKEISGIQADNFTVLATYDLRTNDLKQYYRVNACKNYLQFLQTYRSDVDPDIIYSRTNF